jgi:tRNA(fMet)-specific endonuclease VapC
VADPLYLLDSNICIYLVAGRSLAVKARVEACAPGEVATSSVAFAEVMMGARRLGTEKATRALFDHVTILPFDDVAGHAYAELPFKRGRFDRLIAAHALSLHLTLVTNNPRDFDDVGGLRVENWTLA